MDDDATRSRPDRRPAGARDSGDRAARVQIGAWSLVGAFLGFALGFYLIQPGGGGWPGGALVPVGGAVMGWVLMYASIRALSGAAGAAASNLYMPSAGLGPRVDHSLAESLEARGRYAEAVASHEATVAEHPTAVEAYLAAARIAGDHLDDPVAAERWLKRARTEAAPTPAQQRLVARQLVELYRRSGRPERAAPELARLAEMAEGSPEGRWAREELARVKEEIASERE